jgi:hypothetical protein
MINTSTGAQHQFRDRIEVILRDDLPECTRGWAVEEVEQAVMPGTIPLVGARVTLRRLVRAAAQFRADIAADLDGHLIHGRGEASVPRVALHAAAEQVHGLAVALDRRDRECPPGSNGPAAGARMVVTNARPDGHPSDVEPDRKG